MLLTFNKIVDIIKAMAWGDLGGLWGESRETGETWGDLVISGDFLGTLGSHGKAWRESG